MPHTAPAEAIAQILHDVGTTRDEARQTMHLFSLESRHRWNDFESKLQAVEDRIAHGGEQVFEVTLVKARALTCAARAFVDAEGRGATAVSTRVQAIMSTHVSVCFAGRTLSDAARIMWEHDCGSLPVVDAMRSVVGILTDRDICMAAYTRGTPLSTCAIESAMSCPVYSCAPDDSIEAVVALMESHQVRRVPVIEPDGNLVGIVAFADIVRHAHSAREPWLLTPLEGLFTRIDSDDCEEPRSSVRIAAVLLQA